MKVSVVIPIYNDWDCLYLLAGEINQFLLPFVKKLTIYVVNDCSSIPFPVEKFQDHPQIIVLNLVRNLGHQKAIAIGLSYLADTDDSDCVIVMDGDGEDKPSDLPAMLQNFIYTKRDRIIFAHRKSRKESMLFKLMYYIYKIFFKILTGNTISFGNFCIIPRDVLKKIVFVSEIWNHFPGGVIRSKLPYSTISLERGKRLMGKSKMNIVSLVIHGISSVSVHLDVVSVRLLLFASFLIGSAFLSMLTVIYIRLFTNKAIPGWATFTVIGIGSIVLQAFFICLMLTFMVLFYRTQRQFIPASEYKLFLERK